MAKDWEKLAGEEGKPVETGRWGRALKLGSLATKVTGSAVAQAIKNKFRKGEEATDATAEAALKHADKIVKVMGEMKGAAMKIGQILSSDPDLVAPEFADHLTRLQRSAPPMTYETVVGVIEKAFDRKMPELFRFFDPKPIGSASIGQVHRATLADGRQVALKVQYPGIVESLDSDLKNLGSLMQLGRVFVSKQRLEEFLAEARTAILNEADYELEARNLARVGPLLMQYPGIRVPRPMLDATHKTVLTMEFIEGEKLDDALNALPDQAEKDLLLQRFVAAYVHMFHDLHLLHADPHPGNFLLDRDHNIVFLDFGCIREFEARVPDGVLRLLVAFWRDDMPAMEAVFREMGFGTPGGKFPSHQVMHEYHQIILAPIWERTPFDFGTWTVHTRLRRYMRDHMELMRLVPPAELVLYLRVLTGIKGLMTRMGARIELRTLAEEMARRHGFLP